MFLFCHLLNDNSGSPVVLRDAINAIDFGSNGAELYVGSQGKGALEHVGVPINRYWYRRSNHRAVTLITFVISQIHLYWKLTCSRARLDSLVYVNTLLPFGAAIWGKLNRRKVVYHIHEVSLSPKVLQRFLIWVAQRTASLAIYVSYDNKERLPIRGVPSVVIYNAVSPQVAAAALGHRYAPRRSGKFEVLMLASPRDFKGVPEFLKLAERLLHQTDIAFQLVLNSSDEDSQNYLNSASVPDNVKVNPRADRPELYYKSADLLLNLSRVDQWIETFGLTLVEAMSFGIPVIAPPVGGPSEIITDGEEGFLIDSRDVDLLGQRVMLLAETPDLSMQMSVKARRRAHDFSFESFAVRLREALASVTAGKA